MKTIKLKNFELLKINEYDRENETEKVKSFAYIYKKKNDDDHYKIRLIINEHGIKYIDSLNNYYFIDLDTIKEIAKKFTKNDLVQIIDKKGK